MEIIVSLTILSITMVGLLNVFISAKKHSLLNRSRVSASELAKYFLDPLQMQVRQDQWGSNCLSSNPPSGCPSNQTIANITYNVTYAINNVTETEPTALRRVIANITWFQP